MIRLLDNHARRGCRSEDDVMRKKKKKKRKKSRSNALLSSLESLSLILDRRHFTLGLTSTLKVNIRRPTDADPGFPFVFFFFFFFVYFPFLFYFYDPTCPPCAAARPVFLACHSHNSTTAPQHNSTLTQQLVVIRVAACSYEALTESRPHPVAAAPTSLSSRRVRRIGCHLRGRHRVRTAVIKIKMLWREIIIKY